MAGPAAEWQHLVAPQMPETCAALPSVHAAMQRDRYGSVVLVFERAQYRPGAVSESTRALDDLDAKHIPSTG